MANAYALEELRSEGLIPWEVDRRVTKFLVRDLYSFGDVMAYDPTYLRRPRLVNACQEDVQKHIKAYLEGGLKDDGTKFPPNIHLKHLLQWFDCMIYSFVLRRNKESGHMHRVCRKWQAILSPIGIVGFERQE